MKTKHLIILILIVTSLASCSVMQKIERNHKFTEKQLNKLYHKNGNAFGLNSCYATFSRVWTYCEGKIEIYGLYNGKIQWKETYKDNGIMQYADTSLSYRLLSDDLYRQCPMALDGDDLHIMTVIDGKELDDRYPLNIKCLKQVRYESGFLNKIANDIVKYKIWEVKSVSSDTSDGNK